MNCKEQFQRWVDNKEKRRRHYEKRKQKLTGPITTITPVDAIKYFQVWQVAWVLGRKQGRMDMTERKPLSDQEMKDLWNAHGIGKEFGRAIERLHGIK